MSVDSLIQTRKHLISHTDTTKIVDIEKGDVGFSYDTFYYDSTFKLYSLVQKEFMDSRDKNWDRSNIDSFEILSNYFGDKEDLIKVAVEVFKENKRIQKNLILLTKQ